ncbi:uncharacterized protein LOC112466736 [Temnothorax curvispinosus]|uniref:Uncharacterized protein LOC112466736 n=1 Tax=Temnothorax curvispinosus TaxID=300111 RepID=A0A6J1RDA5_9HYME|nr:uncharacterized protein LOC112466736 [Temnothorax curvispinosus]
MRDAQNASMSQGVKNVKDDDHGNPGKNLRFCRVLSVALSGIIRHSANINFRDRCLALSRSSNSSSAQAAFAADLLSIVSRDDARKKTDGGRDCEGHEIFD